MALDECWSAIPETRNNDMFTDLLAAAAAEWLAKHDVWSARRSEQVGSWRRS